MLSRVAFESAFELVDSITLAESNTVINVVPIVTPDPLGGFLIADRDDVQIRRYDPAGELLWHFGRRGAGPGEFVEPVKALRLTDEEVLAIDVHSRATIWSESTGRVVRTVRHEQQGVEDAIMLPDGRLLLSVRVSPLAGHDRRFALVVIDLEDGSVLRRFFAPSVDRAMERSILSVGWSHVDLRRDRVLSTFSIADTLYVHTIDGTLESKVPLGGSAVAELRFPVPEIPADMRLRDWMSTRPFVSRAFWLDDETIITEVMVWIDGEILDPRFSLVIQGTEGNAGILVEDTPRLYGVAADAGLLFFSNPDHLEPNRILVMRRVAP